MNKLIIIFLLLVTPCKADGILIGGFSKHAIPDDNTGYNETHHTFGLYKDFGRARVAVFYFKNSYHRTSFAASYSYRVARWVRGDFSVSLYPTAGLATGYKDTAANMAVMPFLKLDLELKYKRWAVVPSVMPTFYKGRGLSSVGAVFMVNFEVEL